MDLKNYWVSFLLLFNMSFFFFFFVCITWEKKKIDKDFFKYTLVSLELYIVTINTEKS